MNKVFTTIFRIAGEMDGSLMKAISTAQNALRGLNKVSAAGVSVSGKAQQGYLGLKLQELQKMSAALEKYKAAQTAATAALQKSLEAQKKQTELRREYTKAAEEATRLKERLKDVERQRELARSAPERERAAWAVRAAQADYRAQLGLKAQAYAGYKAGELRAANLNAAYQRQNEALRQLQSRLSAAGITVQNMAAAEARLRERITETTAVMARQAANRYVSAHQANNIAGNDFNNAWGNMANATDTSRQILQPFISSVSTAMTYEAELSRSKALTQMDHINEGNVALIRQEMAMLDARYKEIGRTTQFSATQAAGAGNYLAMAGWNAEKINAGLPSVVNLAIASGSGVESAADILSNIQTGFGMDADAESIQHLADVLTYTVTHSNQNLQQLGDTMKYVAPVAKMFGSRVEETAALTKFMADAGIQGSMAGTSLRATMLRLVAPPKKASKAMQENGITVDDATKAWVNAQETDYVGRECNRRTSNGVDNRADQ